MAVDIPTLLSREPGGIWIPNEVIDLHAPHLGSRALHVYCLLARCSSQKAYPSRTEIARLLGISVRLAGVLVGRLREAGLLNNSDLARISGCNSDVETESPDP
jgi:hypothetical protein